MKRQPLPAWVRDHLAKFPSNGEAVAAVAKATANPCDSDRNPGDKASNPRTKSGSLSLLPAHGTPGPWRLVIDGWRPTLNNELLKSHYRTAYRFKQADARQLLAACLVAGVPRAKTKRRLTATIRRENASWLPDGDAVGKSLRDGLVTIGALVDDGPEWVLGSDLQYEAERGALRMVLVLEDMR